MWLPLGENRTLLVLLGIIGLLGAATGFIAGGLRHSWGYPATVAGAIFGVASLMRLYWIERAWQETRHAILVGAVILSAAFILMALRWMEAWLLQ